MNSIAYHSKMSDYYKYRNPYVDELFAKIADVLKLNNSSVIMDLCCGSGEMSSGLARYVKNIHAIDGSREMLSLAPSIPNVKYYNADVCNSILSIDEVVDHIVIGKAIHWLEANSLYNIIKGSLRKCGKIAIVFCQSERTEWSGEVNNVLNKFGRRLYGHDFTGKYILNEVGYVEETRIITRSNLTFNVDWLIKNLISLAYGKAFNNIMNNMEHFTKEIERIVYPFTDNNGTINRGFENIALIYRPR